MPGLQAALYEFRHGPVLWWACRVHRWRGRGCSRDVDGMVRACGLLAGGPPSGARRAEDVHLALPRHQRQRVFYASPPPAASPKSGPSSSRPSFSRPTCKLDGIARHAAMVAPLFVGTVKRLRLPTHEILHKVRDRKGQREEGILTDYLAGGIAMSPISVTDM